MSASVNLSLHHKVQKLSSGTGSPGWSQKKGHKTVVIVVVDFTVASAVFLRRVSTLTTMKNVCQKHL